MSYDNLKSGKSGGCRACGGELSTKYETELEYSLRARGFAARFRCTAVEDARYADYGGRGIEFRFASIEEYVAYCLSLPGACIEKEIDRVDNNGHYEPGNLRWATRAEQTRNTRRSRLVEWNGEVMCASDFIRRYTNLSGAHANRLLASGKTTEELVAYVPRGKRKYKPRVRHSELRTEE